MLHYRDLRPENSPETKVKITHSQLSKLKEEKEEGFTKFI